MAGYVRQSAAEIQDTLTINAIDLDNEFNSLVADYKMVQLFQLLLMILI